MSLRWLFIFLILSFFFAALESKTKAILKSKLKLTHSENEIYDTNKLKKFNRNSIEKHYNKKFHYYTIKTLFVLSMLITATSLILNLKYFWSTYTKSLVLKEEFHQILQENVNYFENEEIFKNFNDTLAKLNQKMTNSYTAKRSLPAKVIENVVELKDDDDETFKKEDTIALTSKSDNDLKSSDLLTDSSETLLKPFIHIVNSDTDFYKKSNLNDESTDRLSSDQILLRTKFFSNVKVPTKLKNHCISSTSESSLNNNVIKKDGTIELIIRSKLK